MSEVRVRFAPSPTGALHIGGVRTALYNYLFAKQNNGKFILRIEDTDSTRFVQGAEQYIINSFKWLGIKFDEGVHIPNEKNISYRQSERKDIYKKYVDYLLENNLAYIAFDTPEEIEEKRKLIPNFQYDASVRMSMNNSLTLPEETVKQKIANKEKYVVRILINQGRDIEIDDIICGKVIVNSSVLDDKVLWKSADGLPTYHLANVVDDHLMEITHVIRGKEWLPSAPLHVLLYEYLGWEDTMPRFAHLPLILKPDGNGKLSKRDGERLGFPVFPLVWTDPKTGIFTSGYKEIGFLPEAVINFLALLGWNSGSEQEIFSMEELIENFSLERVNKSSAKFDYEKAKWFNHEYIQQKDNDELVQLLKDELAENGLTFIKAEKLFDKEFIDMEITSSEEYLRDVIGLVKERIHLLSDFYEQAYFFFIPPTSYDETVIKKRWKKDTAEHLTKLKRIIFDTYPFNSENIHDAIKNFVTDNDLDFGQILSCLRLAVTGLAKGVDICNIIEIIGFEETAKRIEKAISVIDS